MKIGELSRQTETSVETIRFYEREGLLPQPARTSSNYRTYAQPHLERLQFIRHCRGLDMALDEIRALLHFKDHPEQDCAEVNALLDAHIGHVAQRIKALRGLEQQLRELRASCVASQHASHCGILNGLSACEPVKVLRPEGGNAHVHGAHGRAVKR